MLTEICSDYYIDIDEILSMEVDIDFGEFLDKTDYIVSIVYKSGVVKIYNFRNEKDMRDLFVEEILLMQNKLKEI